MTNNSIFDFSFFMILIFGCFYVGIQFERSAIAPEKLKKKIKEEAISLQNEYLIELKIIFNQVVMNVLRVTEETLPRVHYEKIKFFSEESESAAFAGDYENFVKVGKRMLDGIFKDSPLVLREKITDLYAFLQNAFRGIEDEDLPETISGLASFSKTVGEKDAERKALWESLSKKETPST